MSNNHVELMETGKGGSVLVRNEGGYVARFRVTYTLDNKEYTRDSGNFPLGQNRSVDIPAGATDIHLKVEDLVWPWPESWSTIFTKSWSSPETHCYKVYGTTLNPAYAEIKC